MLLVRRVEMKFAQYSVNQKQRNNRNPAHRDPTSVTEVRPYISNDNARNGMACEPRKASESARPVISPGKQRAL